MFARGAEPGRVRTWMYNEEDEDFTRGMEACTYLLDEYKHNIHLLIDATELDVWVYDRLQSLFLNASSDAHLDAELREDKTIFFLHLLGLDTTGHSYRPHSKVSSKLYYCISLANT